MSHYYVTQADFQPWLSRAQKALVSKNKVRKDLWTDFSDIIKFEEPEEEKFVVIPKSHFTSLSSFLLTEGRSDALTSDLMLSWITTLHDLRSLLNEEVREYRSRASSIASSVVMEPKVRPDVAKPE